MVFTLRSVKVSELNNIPTWMIVTVLIGAYGPSVAAVILTAYSGGRLGLKSLFSRFFIWRAPAIVHILIWLAPPAFLVIAMLLAPKSTTLLGTPEWAELQFIPQVLLAGIIFGPMGEELGWRGYALPSLQKKHSALVSSLLIGVAWCFWHAPLFWAPGGTTISGYEVTIAAVAKYLVFTCGLAILFTWVFNNSKGSLLLVVAFHTSGNAAFPMLLFPNGDPDAALTINWLSMIPLWILVLVLIAIYGGARLSKESDIQ